MTSQDAHRVVVDHHAHWYPRSCVEAVRTYGAGRLVFGTDHPFGSMTGLRRYIEVGLPPETTSEIYANRVSGLVLAQGSETSDRSPRR